MIKLLIRFFCFLIFLLSMIFGVFAAIGLNVFFGGNEAISSLHSKDPILYSNNTIPYLLIFLFAPCVILSAAGSVFVVILPIYARFGLREFGKEKGDSFLFAYAKMLVKIAGKPEAFEKDKPAENQNRAKVIPEKTPIKPALPIRIILFTITYSYVLFLIYLAISLILFVFIGAMTINGIERPDKLIIAEVPFLQFFLYEKVASISALFLPMLIIPGLMGYYDKVKQNIQNKKLNKP